MFIRTSTIKSIAALILTATGTAFVFGFKTADDLGVDTTAQGGTGSTTSSNASGSTATPPASDAGGASAAPSGSTAGSGSTASEATYADGTWTGNAVSEPWGPFQVEVVISDGQITDVNVVESPSDRRSNRINSQAVPRLTESVIASQGTNVDMVSGATWTSDSYATSLQSALDEAAAA